MKDDKYYIHRCEILGKAAGLKGNAPVGALIVRQGSITAEAEEAGKSKNDITCHAEIEAIRIAIRKLNTTDLSDCVLYSTHEPCVMCSYAIRYYRISKVVFLHAVQLGGATSSMPLLTTKDVPPHWAKAPEVVQLKLSDE